MLCVGVCISQIFTVTGLQLIFIYTNKILQSLDNKKVNSEDRELAKYEIHKSYDKVNQVHSMSKRRKKCKNYIEKKKKTEYAKSASHT